MEPGNPNPRVHRSSGKLGEALFPTGSVDPRVGISLSPLNTNDGFSLSGVQEKEVIARKGKHHELISPPVTDTKEGFVHHSFLNILTSCLCFL